MTDAQRIIAETIASAYGFKESHVLTTAGNIVSALEDAGLAIVVTGGETIAPDVANHKVNGILAEAKSIWGDGKLSLPQIIVCIGVIYGDICRQQRNGQQDVDEIKKELGNLIVSTIRWCDDLGLSANECIDLAMDCQREFVRKSAEG